MATAPGLASRHSSPPRRMTLTVTIGSTDGIPSPGTVVLGLGGFIGGTATSMASLATATGATANTMSIPSGTNLNTVTVRANASIIITGSGSTSKTGTCSLGVYEISIQ